MQVRTYGPDVDLAIVEIDESVADDFWASPSEIDARDLHGTSLCRLSIRWVHNGGKPNYNTAPIADLLAQPRSQPIREQAAA